jgi:hypothetical protein
MKKSGALFFLASFFLLPSYNAFGQATDSLAFTKNAFVRKKIGPGLEWQSRHFSQKELFGSNQNINILEVKRKNRRLHFGFAAAGMWAPLRPSMAVFLTSKTAVPWIF